MTMQNGHDMNVHIPYPIDDEIFRDKLIGVHPSNISWHILLTEIYNSPISYETYHDHCVATYLSVVRLKSIHVVN